jgi:hypothetical protein
MSDQYVILTGAKNNAGDYLIKWRAKQLFSELRKDRTIIDYDGWKKLTAQQLDVINQSRALILTGGPALQKKMYKGIYPLTDNLANIRVPIATMAVGWKGRDSRPETVKRYELSEDTLTLLRKIDGSGYQSSVRDFHTLEVLRKYGFNNFSMTGCSALYSIDHIDKKPVLSKKNASVSFSLGVSFYKTPQNMKRNKELIFGLRDLFHGSDFKVVFHHSTDPDLYRRTHHPNLKLVEAQNDLMIWLDSQDISHVDISGSAEALVNHYEACDFHIGYRVHAHIFMSGISRKSVLIAEDGRGGALGRVVGGLFFDDCPRTPGNRVAKYLEKLGVLKLENDFCPAAVLNELRDEQKMIDHTQQIRRNIDQTYPAMKAFLQQLP